MKSDSRHGHSIRRSVRGPPSIAVVSPLVDMETSNPRIHHADQQTGIASIRPEMGTFRAEGDRFLMSRFGLSMSSRGTGRVVGS